MNLKDKTCLVYDKGLYVELALRLARDFGKVFYYNHYKDDYSRSEKLKVGDGFSEITKVYNFWDIYMSENIDLFVFPNIMDGDLQDYLIQQGKFVWGSREAEMLEKDRMGFVEYLKKLDMPIPETQNVTGIDELRNVLYSSPDKKVVKMQGDERGDGETFIHKNNIITEKYEIRPLEKTEKAKEKKFLVQSLIPTKAEIGYDGFCIDGKYPDTALFGIEVKDMGYIGEVRKYEDLPEGVKYVNDKFSKTLKSYGYRGNWSTEIREGEDGKHYFIDPTCRCPYPPTNLMLEIWDNISECMYQGSRGILVDMKFKSKYGIEVEMFDETAKDYEYVLIYPEELNQWVKQPYITYHDNRKWVQPQTVVNSNVGSLIAIGDSIEECVILAKERADKIIGKKLKIDFSCLDSAIKELKTL